MQRTRQGSDGPGQRLAFFRRKKGIAKKEQKKSNLPAEGERPVTAGEMEALPFAFHRPGKRERDQSQPARARNDSETEKKDREEKCRDEKRRGIRDRQPGERHEQKQKGHRGRERRDVSPHVLRIREEFAGREERGGKEKRPGAGRYDQEFADVHADRREFNPEGRGENGHDQGQGDGRERTPDERHRDRDEIENENAQPDGGRG